MKNKYCPVPLDEHNEDGKVKTSVGEMPCKYCKEATPIMKFIRKELADARKEVISKVENLPQYWDLDGERLCVKRSDVLATLREEEQHG